MRLPRAIDRLVYAPDPVIGPEKVVPSDRPTEEQIKSNDRAERRKIYENNVPQIVARGRTMPYDPDKRYSGQCVDEGIVLTPPKTRDGAAQLWPEGIDALLILCADSQGHTMYCTTRDGTSIKLQQNPKKTAVNERMFVRTILPK